MKSRWFKLKLKAIKLRKQGRSIVIIEKTLGIPKSTLSSWFKNLKLTPKQKLCIKKNLEISLINSRKKAVIWHNTQKRLRIEEAEKQALSILKDINISSKEIIELALAMLYLGEGFKKRTTGIGNSDPLILKFFLVVINKMFGIDKAKIRYDLHLRADQNPIEIKEYWSNELKAPISRFTQVSIDKRTFGKTTYPDYKGVCVIDCGNIAIQRKLVYLSRRFCEKIIKHMGG